MRNLSLFLAVCLLLGEAAGVSAQDETITITTYYPSPYGVYKNLRIYPNNEYTPDTPCSTEGEMFYSSLSHKLYICSGSLLKWRGAIDNEVPKGLYGICTQSAVSGIDVNYSCSSADVRAPAFCQAYPSPFAGTNYYKCACPSEYELIQTGSFGTNQSASWPTSDGLGQWSITYTTIDHNIFACYKK